MVKKIKFALVMADGCKVRTLEDLREHFDLEKVTGYFLDGKLQEWLADRYYDIEVETLQGMDTTAADFSCSLCAALGVEYEDVEHMKINIDTVVRLNEKRAFLQQRTDDVDILTHAAQVALTQEDLADLLDAGIREIYLCGELFTIPMRIEHCRYYGILGTPEVRLAAKSAEELEARDIELEHLLLPELLREAEAEPTVSENHKQHKRYRVSKLLDHQMSEKDRANASKMYDTAQELLELLVFDIDVSSRPLEEAAHSLEALVLDIDVASHPLEEAARSMDLPSAWQTYLARMA